MDNDYEIEDIIVQRGVMLLEINGRPGPGSALNKTGVLSFRKFLKQNVHFFHWRALDASSTATLHLLFRDLSCLEYTEDNKFALQADDRCHSKYQFKEGLAYRLVEFLERKGFIRWSNISLTMYLPKKEPSVFGELSKDLETRLDSVQDLLPLGSTLHPVLADRLKPFLENTVYAKEWTEFFDSNGVITDPDFVKCRIFKGGVAKEIRRLVWPYLLDLDKWENSNAENEARRRVKREEYCQMKQQAIEASQELTFISFEARICAIGKDANQTDSSNPFYSDNNNRNRDTLRNILMTFQWHNLDLSYASGMAELAAPILSVMQTEADAYWCFAGFMEKMIDQFDLRKAEMKEQRRQLLTLLAFVNRRLYRFLTEDAAGNDMYFCCRWLEVWFKKDFTYPHVMHLWEVLWTGLPCQNFHRFVCAAILEQETDIIIKDQLTSHDKLVSHLVGIAGKLDAGAVLMNAESIHDTMLRTLKKYPGEFVELRKIFGIRLVQEGP